MLDQDPTSRGGTPGSSPPTSRVLRHLRHGWRYTQGVRARRALHSEPRPDQWPTERAGRDLGEILASIDRGGYVVLEDFVDPTGLEQVSQQLDRALETGRVLPVLRGLEEPGKPRLMEAEEVSRGDEYLRPRAYIVYVDEPFMTCPASLPYVFSDLVECVARGVYGCAPLLTAGKVMRSYANELPILEFNWFHSDTQARRILKFFIYLHDVEPGGGAFCYVAGSHRRKPRGLCPPVYLSDAEAADFYGRGAVRELTAKRGTVIVADTVGYHRAGKPVHADRSALLITTGVHPFPDPLCLPREYVSELDPRLRSLADLAVLKDS